MHIICRVGMCQGIHTYGIQGIILWIWIFFFPSSLGVQELDSSCQTSLPAEPFLWPNIRRFLRLALTPWGCLKTVSNDFSSQSLDAVQFISWKCTKYTSINEEVRKGVTHLQWSLHPDSEFHVPQVSLELRYVAVEDLEGLIVLLPRQC